MRPSVIRGLAAPAAALLALACSAHAADFSADLPAVRAFLDQDVAYSAAERVEAEAAFTRLSARASDISAAAFQVEVARIAALAQNGHTMLLAGLWPFQFDRTPLRYHMFADGMRVVDAPDSMRDLVGARLVSVDGKAVDAVDQVFAGLYGALEGRRKEWLGYFVESPPLLFAAGVARRKDRVRASFELPDGRKTSRVLKAERDPPEEPPFDFLGRSRLVVHAGRNIAGPLPLYLDEPDRPFRFAILKDLDAAYLQVRTNLSPPGEDLPAFLSATAQGVREAGVKTLIVDLRFNGGGDLNLTRDFMSGAPSLTPADGRIFVITSGRTFSAGIASAGYLKQAAPQRTIIVGEPIGDHLEYHAEGDLIELPQSGAFLLSATERHNYVTGCPEPDCHAAIRDHPIRVETLEPDMPAPLRYADYAGGVDPALEAIRAALEASAF